MSQEQTTPRPPGITYAISDTGPLISAFQSDSFGLLLQIFPDVRISSICRSELVQHGWENEIRAIESRLEVIHLTFDEEQQFRSVAEQIAQHPGNKDRVIENHLGEAQAIVVALRDKYQRDLLLLDELAARGVAK